MKKQLCVDCGRELTEDEIYFHTLTDGGSTCTCCFLTAHGYCDGCDDPERNNKGEKR